MPERKGFTKRELVKTAGTLLGVTTVVGWVANQAFTSSPTQTEFSGGPLGSEYTPASVGKIRAKHPSEEEKIEFRHITEQRHTFSRGEDLSLLPLTNRKRFGIALTRRMILGIDYGPARLVLETDSAKVYRELSQPYLLLWNERGNQSTLFKILTMKGSYFEVHIFRKPVQIDPAKLPYGDIPPGPISISPDR